MNVTKEYILARVELREGPLNTPCWIWTKGKATGGYGQVGINGSERRAHRLAFMLWRGELSKGDLHHRCETPACCNPWHLDDLTRREHAAQHDFSANGNHMRVKTHCPQGHPYSPENTLWQTTKRGRSRTCKICHREHSRASMRRKRLAHQ